uniref:Uncharacterized protein n=1 Tax=Anguilla anguilla TaxID=7936 RepID=A0A0E9WQ21_ANGAN
MLYGTAQERTSVILRRVTPAVHVHVYTHLYMHMHTHTHTHTHVRALKITAAEGNKSLFVDH